MKKTKILKPLPFICLVLSLLFLALSMARNPVGDIEKIADKAESRLAARMKILDTYIQKALETEEGSWPEISKLPDDMVIYRYVNDSLQSWSNQFTVLNDDISSKLVFQRMSNMMDRIVQEYRSYLVRNQIRNGNKERQDHRRTGNQEYAYRRHQDQ